MNEETRNPGASDGAAEDDVYELEDTGEDLEEVLAAAVAATDGDEESRVAPVNDEELQKLREENAALKDQYVRSRADFDNFRKRAEREKADYFRYALSGLLQELLAVVDNFERALATESSGDDFRRGVEMIHRQLVEILQKAGLREVEETDRFDPTVHEGVMREERPDLPANSIVQTLQKGYYLHDRLLRPAMVKVATGGPDRSPTENEG